MTTTSIALRQSHAWSRNRLSVLPPRTICYKPTGAEDCRGVRYIAPDPPARYSPSRAGADMGGGGGDAAGGRYRQYERAYRRLGGRGPARHLAAAHRYRAAAR